MCLFILICNKFLCIYQEIELSHRLHGSATILDDTKLSSNYCVDLNSQKQYIKVPLFHIFSDNCQIFIFYQLDGGKNKTFCVV